MYVRKSVCLPSGVIELDGEVVGPKEAEPGRVTYINE